MKTSDLKYSAFVQILKSELIPAMGCTEPVAVAYSAAKAREILGEIPRKVAVELSGNIIKNIKSVTVPNTGGLKGIEASIAAGIIAGQPEMMLEVLSTISKSNREEIGAYLKTLEVEVRRADTEKTIYIKMTEYGEKSEVTLEICDTHTNITHIEKDGEVIFSSERTQIGARESELMDILCVEAIIDFADTVQIEDVRTVIEKQIACNTAISQKGIQGNYGANIGSTLLKIYGDDIKVRAKAAAAAGSDARMSGCEMPVVIVSGSGNQGLTASLPVIEYAKEYHRGDEALIRALVVSNLLTAYLKNGIGRLSAYCGAVSAGAAAGAAIAYLLDGGLEGVTHTLVNALAVVSGIICDGAKPSCAAKIAASVDAGLLGYYMYQNSQQFYGGDGIVSKGVENTIKNVSRLGKDGMKSTDKEIIDIMLCESLLL